MAIKCPTCRSDNPDTLKFCGECGTQLPPPLGHPPVITETLQTPVQDLTTGITFAGRYQIIEELGRGGMGRVYKVYDTKIKEKIALKLIRPEVASDKETIERFSNELRLARGIRHKNVCGMYDLGEAEGAHFITMEYVHGEDLKSMIRMSGSLSLGMLLSVGKQVCDGLAEAHSLGVIHRDLKPQNIMIDKNGNAKIMDFGIARSVREKGITGPSVMIGTPEYMSPEQAEAKELDHRSDIYSLGVILYEMATSHVPFEGETALSIAMKHKGETPKNPRSLNPHIPDDLSGVILKCLEKDTAKRYQSAADVHSDLDRIEKGIPTAERVVPERKTAASKRITVQFELRKVAVPAALLIAASACGLLLWKFLPRKEAAPPLKIEKSIAVISFENQTGDKAFDYLQKAIPSLLITSLEQRGGFYVVTWERMSDLLSQMGMRDVQEIDREAGFRLCRKEGVEAIILGSFVKAGDVFATDVKVLDVESKKLLKSAGSRGDGVDSILRTQIDELSEAIAAGIGLARERIDAERTRVEDVTTSSMEAYKYYVKGREELYKLYFDDARKSFEKAIALDPEFAAAYNLLGIAHIYLGNARTSDDLLEKAKALSHKVTEKERLYIDAIYAYRIERDRETGIRFLQEIIGKYPKEKTAHLWLGMWYRQPSSYDRAIDEFTKALELDPNLELAHTLLGYIHLDLRDFTKCVEHFQKSVSLNPRDANPVASLADAYFIMGNLDEALVKYKESLALRSDFASSSSSIGLIYALREDPSAAFEWIDNSIAQAPAAGIKSDGYALKGFYQGWLGSFRKGLENLDKAQELAASVGDESGRADVSRIEAFLQLSKGEFDAARKLAKEWFDVFMRQWPGNEAYYKSLYLSILGFIDLKQGKIGSARKALSEVMSLTPALSPDQKEWGKFFTGLFQAEVLLAEGSLDEAISFLEKITWPGAPESYKVQSTIHFNTPFFKDIAARAYLQKGDIDRATAEYERLITFNPKKPALFLVHPELHFRLAKLYEKKGMKDKAIGQYRRFLELSKDADPGIPEVEDARRRLAGLKGS